MILTYLASKYETSTRGIRLICQNSCLSSLSPWDMVSGNKIFSKLDEGTGSEGMWGNWKAKYPNQINPKIKNKCTNLPQNLEWNTE